MERQEQSIVGLESVECSPERPALDRPIECIRSIRRVNIQLEDPPSPFGRSHRGTDDVLPKPGREGISIPKSRQTPPRGEQRVLNGIFGVGLRAGQDHGSAERTRNERLDQRAERVPIARHRGIDEWSKSG